jgi:hypothetical protein
MDGHAGANSDLHDICTELIRWLRRKSKAGGYAWGYDCWRYGSSARRWRMTNCSRRLRPVQGGKFNDGTAMHGSMHKKYNAAAIDSCELQRCCGTQQELRIILAGQQRLAMSACITRIRRSQTSLLVRIG